MRLFRRAEFAGRAMHLTNHETFHPSAGKRCPNLSLSPRWHGNSTPAFLHFSSSPSASANRRLTPDFPQISRVLCLAMQVQCAGHAFPASATGEENGSGIGQSKGLCRMQCRAYGKILNESPDDLESHLLSQMPRLVGGALKSSFQVFLAIFSSLAPDFFFGAPRIFRVLFSIWVFCESRFLNCV